MKKLFVRVAFVAIGYLVLAVGNMLIVLLLFEAPGFRESDLAPWYILIPVTVLLLPLLCHGTFLALNRIFRTKSLVPIGLLLFLTVVVTLYNIYLDRSVEPLWYKIIYIVAVVSSAGFSIKQGKYQV